jgi:hypothetical protein
VGLARGHARRNHTNPKPRAEENVYILYFIQFCAAGAARSASASRPRVPQRSGSRREFCAGRLCLVSLCAVVRRAVAPPPRPPPAFNPPRPPPPAQTPTPSGLAVALSQLAALRHRLTVTLTAGAGAARLDGRTPGVVRASRYCIRCARRARLSTVGCCRSDCDSHSATADRRRPLGLGAAGPKGRASLQWRARTGYLPALGGMRASASLATSSSPGQHLFLRQ